MQNHKLFFFFTSCGTYLIYVHISEAISGKNQRKMKISKKLYEKCTKKCKIFLDYLYELNCPVNEQLRIIELMNWVAIWTNVFHRFFFTSLYLNLFIFTSSCLENANKFLVVYVNVA